jgi:hypothetical protein
MLSASTSILPYCMNKENVMPSGILNSVIASFAGSGSRFLFTIFWQLFLGFMYSMGQFDLMIVGLLLGYIIPMLWIIALYRLILHKSRFYKLPFPGWMQKDPGNAVIILFDFLFLSAIWVIILSGLYNPAWLKVVFTMIVPVLTFAMLRTVLISPFTVKENN